MASSAAILALVLAGCEIGVEQDPAHSGQGPAVSDELVETRPTATSSPTVIPTGDEQRGLSDTGSWHAQTPRAAKVARGKLAFVEGYRAGYQLAARQSKPMLLFFTAEWCRYCHQMAQEAFTHPQVVALSQNFVCVLIDADAEPGVCRQFAVTGYPTIQFVSARGVPLERVVGKKPGHQLLMSMRAALQTVARHDDDESTSR